MAPAYVYEDSSTGWRLIQAGDLPSGSLGITDLTSTGGSLSITSPTGPTANADVAASGVTAATYGDSTHTAQVTVGADGRVTNASSVAISGSGGAGGLILLYDSGYIGADAASIDTGAGGIAAGHFGLIIQAYTRCDLASGNDSLMILFNNDSGGNYNYTRIISDAAVLTTSKFTGQTIGQCGITTGANATANYFAGLTGTIPAYDGTSNFKTAHFLSEAIDSGSTQISQDVGLSYASASAISRLAISVATAGKKLKAGSRLIIYGVQ